MRVENQCRCLEELLEMEEETWKPEEVHRLSKTKYTREFILSCAELDVCKQPPEGFDPILLELKDVDGSQGIPEPWKGSGVLFLPNSGNNSCQKQFTGLDANCSALESVRRSDCPSWRLSKETDSKGIIQVNTGLEANCSALESVRRSNCPSWRWSKETDSKGIIQGNTGLDVNCSALDSVRRSDCPSWRWSKETDSKGIIQMNTRLDASCAWESVGRSDYNSDFKRHGDLTQSVVEVSGYKGEDMGKRIRETENTDYYQLSRSEKPYRPPHTYQGSRTKYEGKSLSKETIVTESAEKDIQERTPLGGHRIAEHKQHEIKEITVLDVDNSKKADTIPITEELNVGKFRTVLKEDFTGSFKVPSDCSCTVIEKAVTLPLEGISECELGLSDKTCYPITDNATSRKQFNELLSNRGYYSAQRGSVNSIIGDGVSELYEFPFTIAYDLVSSVLEHNPIKGNHQSITTADAGHQTELYNMGKNECTFDDMWYEMLEIIQFEREMELASPAESDQTHGFEVQVSLPDKDILVSIDYPTSSENFVPSSNSNDVSYYDAEIHLLDEDSLITIDDLIAPEDRLVSMDHPTRAEPSRSVPLNSSDDAVDDNAEIQLPDEDSLITIDNLIVSYGLSGVPAADDTSMSDSGDEVAKQPGALAIADPVAGSGAQGLEAPPSLDVTASMVYQEPHFQHSSLHNPCTSINPQMRFQTTLLDPVPFHFYTSLHCYSYPNMFHQSSRRTASPSKKTAFPKLKEFSYPLVQYSLLNQPTGFSQQSHMPMKDVASSDWELEKTKSSALRHQQTAYPSRLSNGKFSNVSGSPWR